MIKLLQVFYEFFKIGLFAIGGGPATIPFLIDLTEKTDWYTMEELTNMIAISESTPGPVGLNMATYVGFQSLGAFGGVVSSVGLTFPSVIVIILIAKFLNNFNDKPYVKKAFWGIRPAVTGLIFAAVVGLCKASLVVIDDGGYQPAVGIIVICVAAFVLMQIPKMKKMHPVVWIVGAAVVGLVFRL